MMEQGERSDNSEASDPPLAPSASAASTPEPEASSSASPVPNKPPKRKWEPLTVPSPMQIMQEDIMNNCFIKGGVSGAIGGVAGFAFGIFTASIENSGGPTEVLTPEMREKPTRVVLREMFDNMKSKSLSYAKGFAYFGMLYSFNECVIEKYRAKHDKTNAALAGCATGAMLAYSAGPQAMCLGCASVGAFSLAIEHFLDSH
ncbi:hypothetical protein QJQ45_017933 [Haematococcus lacustris]|nr:hypothetical protein QJQ45_017933 [Haematococcus lacustris]